MSAYKRISPIPVVEGGTGAQTLTAHGVLLGEGTSAVTPIAVGTTGQVLIGSTSADPSFGALGVNSGLTANGVVIGNNNSALTATVAGTNGQVLTGNTGSAPTFQSPAASSISITGDSGGALSGSAFTFTGSTTGLTFAGSGTTETVGGTLVVGHGGTGAVSLTGVLTGNGTSAVTANAITQFDVLIGGASNAVSQVANGTTGQLLTANTGAAPTFQAPAASSISITGDSGGSLTGSSFTITGSTTGLTFAGAGTTETLGGTLGVAHGGTGAGTLTGVLIGNGTSAVTASSITQHDILVGGASNAITSVAPSATSGVPVISQGASADPAFGTAVVAGGGTGLTSTTAYAVLCGGTTSTGNLQSIAGVGTSGQVLTSNGASALPTFQAAASGSLVKISTQTVNAAASVLFTSGITTTYNNYLLIVSSITTSGAGGGLVAQLSTNGGSSYIATVYLNASPTATTGLYVTFTGTSNPASAITHLMNLTAGSGYVTSNTVFTYLTSPTASTGEDGGIYNGATGIVVNALKLVMTDASNITGQFSLYGYVV